MPVSVLRKYSLSMYMQPDCQRPFYPSHNVVTTLIGVFMHWVWIEHQLPVTRFYVDVFKYCVCLLTERRMSSCWQRRITSWIHSCCACWFYFWCCVCIHATLHVKGQAGFQGTYVVYNEVVSLALQQFLVGALTEMLTHFPWSSHTSCESCVFACCGRFARIL